MFKLHIPDMSCAHCTAAITRALQALDPAATVEFDMDAHVAAVVTSLPPSAVLPALEAAGYPATVAA